MARHESPYTREVRLARMAKKAGITRAEFTNTRTEAHVLSFKQEDAGAASLSASIADVELAADEVYGPVTPGAA